MKTFLIVITLFTNGEIHSNEIEFLNGNSLTTQVACQEAADHLNKISTSKRFLNWAYCIEK